MAVVVDVDSHVYEPPDDLGPLRPGASTAALARSAFYHEVDDEGNRLTIVNGAPGAELNRSQAGAPGDLAAGHDRRRHRRARPRRRTCRSTRARTTRPPGSPTWTRWASTARSSSRRCSTSTCRWSTTREAAAVLAHGPTTTGSGTSRRRPTVGCTRSAIAAAALARCSRVDELDRVAEKGFTSVVDPARRSTRRRRSKATRSVTRWRAPWPDAVRQGLGGGRVVAPALRRGRAVPRALAPHRRARARRVRAPVARASPAPTPSRAAGSPSGCRSGSACAHTIAEPIAYMQDADLFVTTALFHGLLEDLPGLRLAIVHAGTSWVPLALEKSRDLPVALAAVRACAFVCLEPEEVWERQPADRVVRQLGGVRWHHARPARRQGGLGLALPQPRRRRSRRRRARCSRRTASTRQ